MACISNLQRELTQKGWVVRREPGENDTIIATKRNIIVSELRDYPSTKEKIDARSARRSRRIQPPNRGGAYIATLHEDLARKRWSMLVGGACSHNPKMPLMRSRIVRVAIPDYVEYLKQKGWSVRIKEETRKTTITIAKNKPSLIQRLRNLIGR